MKFVATEIDGVVQVELERLEDGRGFFARTWSAAEFAAAGIDASVSECSVSRNHAEATLRGMHIQLPPHSETKLVRCTAGRIFDVAVDARNGSATFGRWTAAELSAENGRALLVPAGCAHGFLTLEPQSEVLYQISPAYAEAASVGFRWDDPDVGIEWPREPVSMSERDRTLPPLAALLPDAKAN